MNVCGTEMNHIRVQLFKALDSDPRKPEEGRLFVVYRDIKTRDNTWFPVCSFYQSAKNDYTMNPLPGVRDFLDDDEYGVLCRQLFSLRGVIFEYYDADSRVKQVCESYYNKVYGNGAAKYEPFHSHNLVSIKENNQPHSPSPTTEHINKNVLLL